MLYFILTLGIVLLQLKSVWCIWRWSAIVFFRQWESMHFHFWVHQLFCSALFVIFTNSISFHSWINKFCLTYKWPIYLLLKPYPSVVIYVDYTLKRKQVNWSCRYQYCLLWCWHGFFFLTSKMLEDLYHLSNLPSFALISIKYEHSIYNRDSSFLEVYTIQ